MPGILRCDRLDLNNAAVVRGLLDAAAAQARDTSHWSVLEVTGRYYFSTPRRNLADVPGWYIICDQTGCPLYVGAADNLDKRLNSRDGTRDNFANPQRSQDPVRNFIKAFRSSGVITGLQVLLLLESSICAALGFSGPLSELDRSNIEKVIGLFREQLATGRPAEAV